MKPSVTVYRRAKVPKVATYNTHQYPDANQKEANGATDRLLKKYNGLIRSALGCSNSYTNVGTG